MTTSCTMIQAPACTTRSLRTGYRAAVPAPFTASRPSRHVGSFTVELFVGQGKAKSKLKSVSGSKSTTQSKGGSRFTGTAQPKKDKQRVFLGPRAPRNEKENAESVVTFVAIASLFLTGVLFVFPALLGGSPATTKPLLTGVNKSLGIEKYLERPDDGLKEGPGPAAAPGTAATQQ